MTLLLGNPASHSPLNLPGKTTTSGLFSGISFDSGAGSDCDDGSLANDGFISRIERAGAGGRGEAT